MLVLGPSAMPEPTVVEAGAAVKLAEAKPAIMRAYQAAKLANRDDAGPEGEERLDIKEFQTLLQ